MTPSACAVSVVLPCRDEAPTVGSCVAEALAWMTSRGVGGEVVVVDNASRDDSARVAERAGARVVTEQRLGYGAALRAGFTAARGTVVVMADADSTYDLTDLDSFYLPIADGLADVVVGNRFAAPMTAAAMNPLHHAGNRALSALARATTGTPVTDLHCGLRSFRADCLADLPHWSAGMEFATHMLVHAHRAGLRIIETPVSLRPADPGRRSHLRPVRDGLRHLWALAR